MAGGDELAELSPRTQALIRAYGEGRACAERRSHRGRHDRPGPHPPADHGAVRRGRRRGHRRRRRAGPDGRRRAARRARSYAHRRGAGRRRRASTRWWSAPGARPTSSTCWPRSRRASRCSARSRWRPRRRRAGGSSRPRSASGRRLVQVGYMRRYDARVPGAAGGGATAARSALPLMMHCTHRNPSVPGHYTGEIDDQRHRGARDRHGALDVRRGDRRRPGAHAAPQPQRRRAAGPAVAAAGDGRRDPRRRRDLGEHPLRLRHPRRGRLRGRHRRAWASRPRSGSAGPGRRPTGCRRTGGSGSSARTTSSCRSGSTRSAATASSARAPGTGTRRPSSPTPALEALRTGERVPVSLVDRPALYEK